MNMLIILPYSQHICLTNLSHEDKCSVCMSAEGMRTGVQGAEGVGLQLGSGGLFLVKLPLLNGQVSKEYTISCKMYTISFLFLKNTISLGIEQLLVTLLNPEGVAIRDAEGPGALSFEDYS